MVPLRVALFVEGSSDPPGRRGTNDLRAIWNECLAGALGLRYFEPVVPISKKHIVAMDPRNPPMSGAGEPLDGLIARMLKAQDFDAAVVAWDLVPAWNPDDAFCRWRETKDFYRLLAASRDLPEPWRDEARARYRELRGWETRRARKSAPGLRRHMILAVCMEPMFEGLLVGDETGVRRALGLTGRRAPGWPSWDVGGSGRQSRYPDRLLLGSALTAARRLRPMPTVCRRVRGDLRTNKSGWGLHVLRELLQEESTREMVLGHPICRRLAAWVE